MKILSIFKSKEGQDPARSSSIGSAEKMRTRRSHPRYKIADAGACYVLAPTAEPTQTAQFRLLDLSFRGCLAEDSKGGACVDIDRVLAGESVQLDLFGNRIRLFVKTAHKRAQGFALVFDLESDAFVGQLSEMLEPLRCGFTCVEIPKGISKEHANVHQRKTYSGDGPFDLVIERDAQGRLIFGMATVRRGRSYGSVIWEHDSIITKKTRDEHGVGARMSQTSEVDRELVQYTGIVCLGMKPQLQDGADFARCLNNWLTSQAK